MSWRRMGRTVRVIGTLLVSLVLAGCSRRNATQDLWVWLDAGALERAGSADQVLALVDSAAAAGARGIVVEVKSRTGEALIPTASFPVARDLIKPLGGRDVLEAVSERARSRGLRVAAGAYVFYGGNARLKEGLVYHGPRNWCLTRYTPSGLKRDDENEKIGWVRLSPVLPAVRKAELRFLAELASRPEVEGIWLVGVEYPDVWSGFGSAAREAFEKWLGVTLKEWPGDVFVRPPEPDALQAGQWFRQWLFWRAQAIHQFVAEAKTKVEQTDSSKWLGLVVGGWLPRSFQQGVNWARPDYEFGNRWIVRDYGQTSIATLGVRLCVGLFFPAVGEKEARRTDGSPEEDYDPAWMSVEGCSKRVWEVVPPETEVAAALHLGYFRGDLKRLRLALRKASSFPELVLFNATLLTDEKWWSRIGR